MNIARLKRAVKAKLFAPPPPSHSPSRLVIKKAKWRHDAESPVLFMIDDLTNAWCLKEGKETDGPAYDWGGKHQNRNSVLRFLHEKLFSDFPLIKTTYFTVVGEMFSFNSRSSFGGAFPITYDEESLDFFRSIQTSEMSEIAYHGVHHGVPQERSEDYIQEWESFQTLGQALDTITEGKALYRDAFGYDPAGGKYCGYKINELSDESIEKSDFIWWCREWTPRDVSGKLPDDLYEVEFFGNRNKVVSIPSTLHGKSWRKDQIKTLLAKKQVISVQEHISPMRPDGRVQTPNIFDDIRDLRRLFSYLNKKNVWYATASEVANYFTGYTNSLIYNVQKDSFRIKYRGVIPDPIITVEITADCLCDQKHPYLKVTLPGGQVLSGRNVLVMEKRYRFMIDLPIRSGRYTLTGLSESE